MPRYFCDWNGRGQTGDKGPDGKTFPVETKGASASEGSYSKAIIDNQGRTKFFSFTFIKMIMQDAENDYLNKRLEKATEKLLWLLDLLEEDSILAQETVELVQKNPTIDLEPEISQLIPIIRRIKILLTQISQGLDYYGHYPNFVPLTSIKVYEETIESMLLLATDIEKAYHEYYKKNQDDITKRKSIDYAVNSLEMQISNLSLQSDQLIIEIGLARKQITNLLNEQFALEAKLQEAEGAFKSAVQREAECGFSDILTASSAIAAIVSGISAVAGGILSFDVAGNMIKKNQKLQEWKKTCSYIVEEAKIVNEGLNGIKKGYNDIKSILTTEKDAAKLIIDQDNFDKTIEPFLHLEEASKYKRLMNKFFELVNLRNNKILEIDTKVTRIFEIKSQQESLEIDIGLTSSRILEVFNPLLAEHISFFDRALHRIKSELIRAIVMQHKALEYWSLKPGLIPKDLQTRTIDHIKSFQCSFQAKLLRLIEERNSAPLKFSTPDIEFTRDLHPEEFSIFDEEGSFTFKINPNSPIIRFYAQALVNEIFVEIEFAEPLKHWAWLFMRHHGNPIFLDLFGKEHSFSHRFRETQQSIPPNKNQALLSLGGNENYSFLSPIASWSLMMEFSGTEQEILTGTFEKQARENVKAFRLIFKGITYSRYGKD